MNFSNIYWATNQTHHLKKKQLALFITTEKLLEENLIQIVLKDGAAADRVFSRP